MSDRSGSSPAAPTTPSDAGDDRHRSIGSGVLEIDTLLGGWRRVTAGYLIEGPAPVLVETGSQSSVPALLDSLQRLGVGASDLAGVVVTHIHLDHAGGVGDVARAFPAATVYVHEKGARHLADPTRLIDSAARVYGSLLDSLYGRLDPTPAERMRPPGRRDDPDRSRPGPHRRRLAGPCQAPRRFARLGDRDLVRRRRGRGQAAGRRRAQTGHPAAGLRSRPGAGVVATLRGPPADRHRPGALRPLAEPPELLEEAEGVLRQWAETAEAAYRSGDDIAEALARRFDSDVAGLAPEHLEKLEVMNGVHSNAAGLRRWLDQRERPAAGA